MKIAPSILACDFTRMGEEVNRVVDAGADMLHLDIMDGHFVPNISFGPLVVENVRKITSVPLDVHLMIDNPNEYIDTFARAGADIITFHFEASSDISETIDLIHRHGIKAGISIKPQTQVEKILKYLGDVDIVLVMTVEPGFGGQEFMYQQIDKVKILRKKIDEDNLNLEIEVDGGINEETSVIAYDNGVDICVAGTSIFKSKSIKDSINKIKRLPHR